jgi:hypothetical protein
MSALASNGTVVIPVLLDDSRAPALLRDIVNFDLRQDRRAGLERIEAFFRRESDEVSAPTRGRDRWSLRACTRRQLRLVAMRCLDDTALKSFCFDAGIDHGSLKGASVHDQLVSLMHLVSLEGLLERFAVWLEAEKDSCVKHQLTRLRSTELWEWDVSEQP